MKTTIIFNKIPYNKFYLPDTNSGFAIYLLKVDDIKFLTNGNKIGSFGIYLLKARHKLPHPRLTSCSTNPSIPNSFLQRMVCFSFFCMVFRHHLIGWAEEETETVVSSMASMVIVVLCSFGASIRSGLVFLHFRLSVILESRSVFLLGSLFTLLHTPLPSQRPSPRNLADSIAFSAWDLASVLRWNMTATLIQARTPFTLFIRSLNSLWYSATIVYCINFIKFVCFTTDAVNSS